MTWHWKPVPGTEALITTGAVTHSAAAPVVLALREELNMTERQRRLRARWLLHDRVIEAKGWRK